MRVVKKRAEFIPTLNSYFVEDPTSMAVFTIMASRQDNLGGDKKLGKNLWEISEEVYARIKHIPHEFIDESVPAPALLTLDIDENDPEGKYAYQDRAAIELRKRENALLFFDTGTGKTRTALLALAKLKKDCTALIITGEANLVSGWVGQAKQFFPELLDRLVVLNTAPSAKGRIKMIQDSAEGSIFILGVESVRNLALVNELNKRNPVVCVLDECQCIIGRNSQQTGGMHSVRSKFRWALSATPIRNTPLEWFSLLGWLRVIKFNGGKTRFYDYYAYRTFDKFGRMCYDTYRHEDELEVLKDLVSIRVHKTGLNLPERVVNSVDLPEDLDLSRILAQIKREKKKEDISATFNLFGYELQAKNTSDLFYIQRVATAMCRSKIEYILEQRSEPLVVVSCHKLPLTYLHTLMGDSVLYHGDVSPEQRIRAKEEFISGKKRVFLMTRKSGGTGTDGLQTVCRRMIMLDAPENMATFNQCADRLHRIGQRQQVLIELLKVDKSLDAFAWKNMEDKQGWIERYFDLEYGGSYETQ